MPCEVSRERSSFLTVPRGAVRVVLVDDDEDLRSHLSEPLRRRGHEVIELNGYELLDYLSVQVLERSRCLGKRVIAPFAVVADMDMPGHDGLALIGGMRRWAWHVPVILVSSREERCVYEEAERLESAALVHKPFDVDLMCETIEAIVRRGVA